MDGYTDFLILQATLVGPPQNGRADRLAERVREVLNDLLNLVFVHDHLHQGAPRGPGESDGTVASCGLGP